jgi:micrococcal nuclease
VGRRRKKSGPLSKIAAAFVGLLILSGLVASQGEKPGSASPAVSQAAVRAEPTARNPAAEVAPAPVVVEAPPVYAAPSRYRTWTDSTGRHKVEAELAEAWGDAVYLIRDGKTKPVPFKRLSQADQSYVRETFPVQVIEGKVVGISDGDTLTLLNPAKAQYKIRLEGIDAPERRQAYGGQSSRALRERVFQQPVKIEWREKDKYGRTLGHVFLSGRWINHEMLKDGWAWHFKKYNQNAILAAAEIEAREAKRGIWADKDPMPPWEYRDLPQAPRPPPVARRSEPPSRPQQRNELIVYVTDTGDKYHLGDCNHLRKSKHPMPLSRAASIYEPCTHCDPPTP